MNVCNKSPFKHGFIRAIWHTHLWGLIPIWNDSGVFALVFFALYGFQCQFQRLVTFVLIRCMPKRKITLHCHRKNKVEMHRYFIYTITECVAYSRRITFEPTLVLVNIHRNWFMCFFFSSKNVNYFQWFIDLNTIKTIECTRNFVVWKLKEKKLEWANWISMCMCTIFDSTKWKAPLYIVWTIPNEDVLRLYSISKGHNQHRTVRLACWKWNTCAVHPNLCVAFSLLFIFHRWKISDHSKVSHSIAQSKYDSKRISSRMDSRRPNYPSGIDTYGNSEIQMNVVIDFIRSKNISSLNSLIVKLKNWAVFSSTPTR